MLHLRASKHRQSWENENKCALKFSPCQPILVLFCYECITLIQIALINKVKCATLCKPGRHKSLESVRNQESSHQTQTQIVWRCVSLMRLFYECIKWRKTKCNYDYIALIFIFHLIFLCKDCSVSLVFQILQLYQDLFNLLLDI